jgi:hypothetical protein
VWVKQCGEWWADHLEIAPSTADFRNVVHTQKLTNLHTSTLKMEATSIPELSATLPTSTSCNNPKTKLTSTTTVKPKVSNNNIYTWPLDIHTSSSSDMANENKHFSEHVQEKRNPTTYKLI